MLQDPHFKVFSGSDPEVETASKRVSKAVGQEHDVTSGSLVTTVVISLGDFESVTPLDLSSSLWK